MTHLNQSPSAPRLNVSWFYLKADSSTSTVSGLLCCQCISHFPVQGNLFISPAETMISSVCYQSAVSWLMLDWSVLLSLYILSLTSMSRQKCLMWTTEVTGLAQSTVLKDLSICYLWGVCLLYVNICRQKWYIHHQYHCSCQCVQQAAAFLSFVMRHTSHR